MNWYKKAQITEKLDKELIKEINQFKDVDYLGSRGFFESTILPTDKELKFLIDTLVDKKGIILTREEHEQLREKIKQKYAGEGFKNRNIFWSIKDDLEDLDKDSHGQKYDRLL